ncbi:Pro-resilin-like 173, partial [Homarus americanus]
LSHSLPDAVEDIIRQRRHEESQTVATTPVGTYSKQLPIVVQRSRTLPQLPARREGRLLLGNDYGHEESRDGLQHPGHLYLLASLKGRSRTQAKDITDHWKVNIDKVYMLCFVQKLFALVAAGICQARSTAQPLLLGSATSCLSYNAQPSPSIAAMFPDYMSHDPKCNAAGCVICRLVAAAFARPDPQYSSPTPAYNPCPSYNAPAHPRPSYSAAPAYPDVNSPQYNSQYAVRDDYSGNDYGHEESRDGYNTQGTYSVLLPDGRVQRVTYYVDGDSGYVAEVTYEGEASTQPTIPPQHSYRPAPASYTPAPSYA